MKVSGLFAGIAGLEQGLAESDHQTIVFCEIDPGATAVLKAQFPDVPRRLDVRSLTCLPRETELVAAGFPCQDLSQAGTTKGINGSKSNVVTHLFRLLKAQDIPHVLIENVPFMLQLNRGQAILYLVSQLESLGYNWAYRVVDAQAFGLPQRRKRVFLIASKQYEPWHVLFAEEHRPKQSSYHTGMACGFYWTEGTRGLAWAVDAVPTIKGGSTIGIPSPPAVWMPDGRIVTPDIRDAERLQGFPADWTKPAEKVARTGHRWKLVGNAVSVKAAIWVGTCLRSMQATRSIPLVPYEYDKSVAWPSAAFGRATCGHCKSDRGGVEISDWPHAERNQHLSTFLHYEPKDLSFKAVTGFIDRLSASSLRYPKEFMDALRSHQAQMQKKEAR
jgi:DNA (cytosine-5)-methyltransferase 1